MIAPFPRVPPPDPAWAFFLDVDGTLVELACTPWDVALAPQALAALMALRTSCGGALALVSGRPIAEVDALLGTTEFAVAGHHGHERRDAEGRVTRPAMDLEPIRLAKERVAGAIARHPGLLLEDKGTALALHYRGAPALASFAHRTMRRVQADAGAGFRIQPGKRVVELGPAGTDKGGAVREFMCGAPFRGRYPVYVGDDATDEHAFRVVNAMGGCSIKVGGGTTEARYRLPDVAAVHAWLHRAAR